MYRRIIVSTVASFAILTAAGIAAPGQTQAYTITLVAGTPGTVRVSVIDNPGTPAARTRQTDQLMRPWKFVVDPDLPLLVRFQSTACLIEVNAKMFASMGSNWSLDIEHGCSITGHGAPRRVAPNSAAGYYVRLADGRAGRTLVRVVENPAGPNPRVTFSGSLGSGVALPISARSRVPTMVSFQDADSGCLVELSDKLFASMGPNWSLDFARGCSVVGGD